MLFSLRALGRDNCCALRKSLLSCFLAFFILSMYAQSPHFSIFDELEKISKSGKGGVVIHQSEKIKRLVGTRIDNENVDVANGKTFLKTDGYRVLVYSGNDQRQSPVNKQPVSKVETMNLKEKINELFPGLEVYIKFDSPWWRLYVGDYLSIEEASVMKRELHKLYPRRKNEIYVVTDEIRLPMD